MLAIPFRIILMAGLLLAYVLRGRRLLRYQDRYLRQLGSLRTTRYSRRALRVLGIDLRVAPRFQEHETDKQSRNSLIVSNHLGYLDVLILAARRPTVFVTSKEIEATPVLGDICRVAGCLFVERRSRRAAQQDSAMLAATLEASAIHLFPEGTSSNGMDVLPFRSSLLAAAEKVGATIAPCCLRYEIVRGRAFSKVIADLVCWYGDMRFPLHFLSLMTAAPIVARVVDTTSYQTTDGFNRKAVSEAVEHEIRACYLAQRSSQLNACLTKKD